MPGFLTHYIAGKAALQGVSKEIKEKIKARERLYNLGTQGPDIFFYYVPGQVRKRSRGIAQQMHLCGLGHFLAYMARFAKDAGNKSGNKSNEERDTIFAYTAGFALHYTVDCNAHPYVYARVFDKNAPKIKNSANHRKFESAIDVALLKLVSGEKPAGLSQWELINAPKDTIGISAEALSAGIKAAYGRDVPVGTSRRAMKFTIKCTRFLQSKNGKRKRFMQLMENITIREPLFSSMVHMQEITGDADCLNIKKTPWQAPWGSEEQSESFMECYNAAVEEGVEILEALYAFVYGDLKPEILAEKLGNRSLKTGLPVIYSSDFTPKVMCEHASAHPDECPA